MATLPFMPRTKPEIERKIHAALEGERAKQETPSTHVRLSSIGKCQRELWAMRTGVPDERPPAGRALMTFSIGSFVEGAIVEWLEKAGYTVRTRDAHGDQFRVVMANGIAIGHIDGMIQWGRAAADQWKLFEAKTAKASKFAELVACESYAKWNPQYHDQLQGYMGASHSTPEIPDLGDALVVVVNKDTSELWIEAIRFDPEHYARLEARARLVVSSDEIVARPQEGKSQYCGFCKYCSRNAWCWSAATDARFDD